MSCGCILGKARAVGLCDRVFPLTHSTMALHKSHSSQHPSDSDQLHVASCCFQGEHGSTHYTQCLFQRSCRVRALWVKIGLKLPSCPIHCGKRSSRRLWRGHRRVRVCGVGTSRNTCANTEMMSMLLSRRAGGIGGVSPPSQPPGNQSAMGERGLAMAGGGLGAFCSVSSATAPVGGTGGTTSFAPFAFGLVHCFGGSGLESANRELKVVELYAWGPGERTALESVHSRAT